MKPKGKIAPATPLLRPADQACVAGIIVFALALIVASWVWQGGLRGTLVEIDRAPPHTVDFRVDLNRADWPELTLLPGIGKTLTQRIVESREQEGPYQRPEDLQRVKGIGPVKAERIRSYLVFTNDKATRRQGDKVTR